MNMKLSLRGAAAAIILILAGQARAQNLVITTIFDGTAAGISPAGMAVDPAGNLYFADEGRAVIEKLSPTGILQLIAGQPGVTGSANGPAASASFGQPEGVALDASGNIYVADAGNNAVRKITPAGLVSTVAGIPGVFGGQNGPEASATFAEPKALATDAAGNLYIADCDNGAIRKINTSGTVSTLATISGFPQGIAIDGSGNIFISCGPPDVYSTFSTPYGDTIYKRSAAGVVTLYAGQSLTNGSTDGPGSQALFFNPSGLATDAAGDLFVADTNNCTIREISPAGIVTTVAGMAGSSGLVDGSGGQARFTSPFGIALDAYGNAFISDGHTVRRGIPSVNTQSPVRFDNLSSRGAVAPSSPLIAGFAIEGTVAQTMLVRAVGPSLAPFGVVNPLPSVQLDIYNQAGTIVASSSAGINATNSGSATTLLGAFPLTANSGDAPLVITLKPGLYSAVVSSPNGGSGTAMVEVYEVP